MKGLRWGVCIGLLLIALTGIRADELSVQIQWDANTEVDLAGYRVYWGNTPDRYQWGQDVGQRTSYLLKDLDGDARYFIAVTAIDFWGNESAPSKSIVIGSEGQGPSTPQEYRLSPSFPNPCKPTTRFDIQIPQDDRVRVTIYNLLGEKVREIENRQLPAGQYRYEWQGNDDMGDPAPAGTYFIRFESSDVQLTRRLVLIR